MNDVIGKHVKIGTNIYAIVYATYENGYMTTAGFLEDIELADVDRVPVLYIGEAALELPINWPHIYALDDKGNKQMIQSVDFEYINACINSGMQVSNAVYRMADGYRSKAVIIIN